MRNLALATTLSSCLFSICAFSLHAEEHALYQREATVHSDFVFHIAELSMGEVKFNQELQCESLLGLEHPEQRQGVRLDYGGGHVQQEVNYRPWRELSFDQEGPGHPELLWEDAAATEWYASLDEELGETFKNLAASQFHHGLGLESTVNGLLVVKDVLELFAERLNAPEDASQLEALLDKLSIETDQDELRKYVRLELSGPGPEKLLHFSTLLALLGKIDASSAALLRDLVYKMPHRDDGMRCKYRFTLSSQVDRRDTGQGVLRCELEFDLFNRYPEDSWVRGCIERRYRNEASE